MGVAGLFLMGPSHQRLSLFQETLVIVHGRFYIVTPAFVTLPGCRRTQRDMLGQEKIIEHGQNVFLDPTFEHNHCKTFIEHYINTMKSLTSLVYHFSGVWCAL